MRTRDNPSRDRWAGLERGVAWARQDDTSRTVVAGAVARGDRAVDALSDLDIELSGADPSAPLEVDAWSHHVGEVLVVETLADPGWHPTRRVSDAAGTIDVMVAGVLPDGVPDEWPVRVAIDKDNVEGTVRRSPRDQCLPTVPAVLRCVLWLAAATIAAACLTRDEPRAARMCDGDSTARTGWGDDTWDNGSPLRVWMEEDLMRRVEACWSGLSLRRSTRALWESLRLFNVAKNVPCSVSRSIRSSTEHRI